MPSNFNKFKYAFLGTLLLLATVITAYQLLYAVPQKKCDKAGAWWSFRYRHCFIPMPIVDITGRHRATGPAAAGASSATASASPAATVTPATSASAAGHP